MVETIIESKCELTRGLEKTHMKPLLAMGDKAAHEIRIEVQKSGQDVGLTGATCSGYFVRSDGVTVPLTGTVQGSAAKVTLSQACYAVPGRFVLVVRLTTGNEISSIFYGDGSVVRSSTDAIIDAEGVIPSLDELLAQIETMEKATAAANTAAGNANAKASAANTAAENANAKASAANTAATKAENAAALFDVLDASATVLPAGSTPTAEWKTVSGKKELVLGIPKGEKGETGSVDNLTVNGKSPNNGNITLTAADVGAVATENAAAIVQENAPVKSVNGQTGTIVLDIPAVEVVKEYASPNNGSFAGLANGFYTLATVTVEKAGLYLVTLDFAGNTSINGRAFIAIDTSRQMLPSSMQYPAASLARVANINAGGTVTMQIFTPEAKTYQYQYYRYSVVLLKEGTTQQADDVAGSDSII